jgi:murein DD-endopeptidase MepM/ murein hydrolase activator NlpD
MMLKRFLTLICFSIVFHYVQAQTYPKNYFRSPLDIPLQLVANFGEIRANHWHMGLDIRTQHRVNLPVHAAAEGYIARVVVEPGGFGQAMYINHPNGLTTLYAHLNAFFPALAQYVKSQQYAQQSWKVDLPIPAQLFPVNKGDFIALSGSTGASEGPHVHFEIRDTRTEKCLNPLLFNLPLPDAVPPTLIRLGMYDRNKSTYDQAPQLFALRKSGSSYVLATANTIKTGSDKISFAIGAVDHFTASPNPNGIYCAEILLDGQPISSFTLDNIGYDETRYINAQLDYPYKSRGGADLQHIDPLPGATRVAYALFNKDGFIHLNDDAPHEVTIEVQDANKNISTLQFNVQYDASLNKPSTASATEKLLPNNVNVFENNGFELFTTEATIYDTVKVNYFSSASPQENAVSDLHTFLSKAIPAHDSVTVRIKPTLDLSSEQKDRVVIKNQWGSRTFVEKAVWQNGWLAAKFRQFGTFQAFVDEEPPAVNAPATNLTRASRLVFTPKDNFNTIKSFRAEVDGQWLCFSNDKGKTWIYNFDEKFPRGQHELKVTVEDEAGNLTSKTWTVTR